MARDIDKLRSAGFDFLYRRDRGEISRGLWGRGALALAAPLALLGVGWIFLQPVLGRTVGDLALVGALTVFAYVYLIVLMFATLMAAICFYNLSAKRFRARGRPPAFAGLSLFCALSAGFALVMQPGSAGLIPAPVAWALAVIALIAAAWTIYELGLAPDRKPPP